MQKGICKHNNGSYHNKTCKAGVVYDDVTPDRDKPGSAYRTPCDRRPPRAHQLSVLKEYGPAGTCDKYCEPSEEELAESKRQTDAAFERIKSTFPLMAKIKKAYKGKDWAGIEICPVCAGKLHMSHAACNGHTHGSCETKNCVAWME